MNERIRYTRKDLKGPDEFVSALGRTVAWVRENRLKVLAAAGALVVAAGAATGVRAYLRWQDEKGSRVLWAHLNRAGAILQAPADPDAQRLADLETALEGLAAANPRSAATLYARYYLGSFAFLRGDYDASAAAFRAAVALAREEPVMAFLARQGLAQALEAKGDATAAATTYAEAAERAGGEMRVDALLGQARTLFAQGRRDEAASVYRRILAEVPDTAMKELVEIKLAQIV